MTQVITAIASGDTAFFARSLETGKEAVVITQLVRRLDSDTRVPCGAPIIRHGVPSTCTNPQPDNAGRCWQHGSVPS